MMRSFLFFLLSVFTLFFTSQLISEIDVTTKLKVKQPNWTFKKTSLYPDGSIEKMVYYRPSNEGIKEIPVKEMIYDREGNVVQETDLNELETQKIVYHGPSVIYDERGRIQAIDFYHLGILHGFQREIYPNGIVKKSIDYKNGIKEGSFTDYYENGQMEKTGFYLYGKLEGKFSSFYQSGSKKSLLFYEKGLLQGEALEWYENGDLKSKKYYTFGLLNGKPNAPAFTEYYPEKIVSETEDFTFGIKSGPHLKYHPNGKESYTVSYSKGKKIGKEFYFGKDGSLIGEGEFFNGQPIFEHYKKNDNETLIFSAKYDAKGTLLEPILEFYETGEKKLQYFQDHLGYQGEFLEWELSGNLCKKYHYKNGHFEGLQEEFFADGSLKLKCNYQNKVKNGSFEEWFENGEKSSLIHYTNGIKTGAAIAFYSTGNKKSEHFFDPQGKLHGEARVYAENGSLLFQADFSHGLEYGILQEWHSNGHLKLIAHYKNGKLHGKEEHFYDSKQAKSKANYENGILDGSYSSWFSNGTIHTEKQFAMGIPVGVHIENYPSDDLDNLDVPPLLKKKICFKDGKLHGEQQSFYKNGLTKAVLNYDSGVLHGLKSLWGSDGSLLEEATYVKDNLNGRYFLVKENGSKVIYHYKDNILDGLHVVYHPEHPLFGKKKAYEAEYVKGLLEGEVIEYNEAGTKIASTFYEKGLKHGPVTIYSHDGKVKIATEFQNDNQNGSTFEFYPSGNLEREVLVLDDLKEGIEKVYYDSMESLVACSKTFKKGVLEGQWLEWDREGTLVFVADYVDGKKNGMLSKYDQNGNPYVLHRYEDDILVEKFDCQLQTN